MSRYVNQNLNAIVESRGSQLIFSRASDPMYHKNYCNNNYLNHNTTTTLHPTVSVIMLGTVLVNRQANERPKGKSKIAPLRCLPYAIVSLIYYYYYIHRAN